ncbi:MAG TPA: extracellular solute-binding protein, partial [Chloroflexota bacterium]|nr:extracellular solute-binding protein [Chloroflexota bacterium]
MTFSRRAFLRHTAVGTVALSAAGLPLLEACTPTVPPVSTTTAPAATVSAAGAFPAFIPQVNKPTPDFPAPGEQYMDGYNNYPRNPARALPSEPPGRGGTVTSLTVGVLPPHAPLDQNAAWQEINKRLGVDFKFDVVPNSDYAAKMATVMAGGDPPDLLFFYYQQQTAITTVPGVPQYLQAQAADLTPYLAGDAIKDYPHLAAIPTYAWKNSGSVYKGRVQMVPRPFYSEGFVLLKNDAIWDREIGKDTVPKNADDWKRILQTLNRPTENRYAMGTSNDFGINSYASIFGAPNVWRLDSGGRLIRNYETPEYREAVAFAREQYAAGLYHPNTLQWASGVVARPDFVAGRFVIGIDGFATAWAEPWRRARAATPAYDITTVPLFAAHDGQKPQHFVNAGHFGATALKKASSPDRVKELLRILNWLAAPFGSEEDLLLTAGVEGTDYHLDANGNPVLTERGNPDAAYLPFKYVAQHRPVLYLPDIPQYAQVLHETEKRLLPNAVADP